jgi:hypothetical protein
MDAARPAPETELQAAFRREFVEPAIERYRAGDREAAVDTFFRGVFGPNYRDPLEQGLPGAFDQAISDADAFFTQELPALWQRWSVYAGTNDHVRNVRRRAPSCPIRPCHAGVRSRSRRATHPENPRHGGQRGLDPCALWFASVCLTGEPAQARFCKATSWIAFTSYRAAPGATF